MATELPVAVWKLPDYVGPTYDPSLAQSRVSYPSDLTDWKWQLVEPRLPQRFEMKRGRKRTTPLREVVNAMLYRCRTDCSWRELPPSFPPWSTVYCYAREWKATGVLKELEFICPELKGR